MAEFKLEFPDQQIEFSVTRQGSLIHIESDDHSVECRITFLEGAYFVLELISADGRKTHIHAAGSATGDDRQIWVDGRTFTYKRARQRHGPATLESSLTTTIPAVVTQILVAPGDDVSAGDKLILLESMKMIIPIQAPFDGTVAAIHCSEGEPVQSGVQLVELSAKGE